MKGKNLPLVIFSFLFILCTATVVGIRQDCPPEPPLDVVTRKTIPVDDRMRDLERLCFRSTCFCVTSPYLDSLCLLLGAYDGLFFSETSALSGDTVENAFLKLLEEINRVVSKKALECGIGVGNGDNNVATLKGSKIDIISSPELEISEMKKLSSCSC
ncbi:hypothetical protein Lal_00033579 [Lupinus albus]|nr:hypothetical protein Lal_00033579 [Lupinus albus]